MYTSSASSYHSCRITSVLLVLVGLLCSGSIHSFAQVSCQPSLSSSSTSTSTSTSTQCSSASDDDLDGVDKAEQKMYNQLKKERESIRYQILAAEAVEPLARRMAEKYPDRFTFHPTTWAKFPDGTDNIEIGGFSNRKNLISGERVLFLGSFHSNDATLSQFQVMITLLQSFIGSLTVVLPFSPVGTMERVTQEGQVATAATYAHSESFLFVSYLGSLFERLEWSIFFYYEMIIVLTFVRLFVIYCISVQ